MKLMITAYNIPPVCNAFSNVVGSLFKDWEYCEFFFITGDKRVSTKIIDLNFIISNSQYVCDIPPYLRKKSFRINLPVYLEHLLLPLIILKMLYIEIKEKPDAIFAMIPTHIYIISSFVVAKICRLPLFCYLVDEWQLTRPHWLQRSVAKFFESKVMKFSRNIFFMTDTLKDIYIKRYPQINCNKFHTLPLPTDLVLNKRNINKIINPAEEIVICFTGAIYNAQKQAIYNLVKAINYIKSYNIKLQLITFADKEVLQRQGIQGEFIEVLRATRSEVIGYQRKADILFLPMSFLGDKDIVTTASIPSKLLEYIVSGTPILVHAPLYTFLGKYTKEKEFGYLVSENSFVKLAEAIEEMILNPDLQKKLVKRAEELYTIHNHKNVSKQLWEYLNLNI